MTLKTPPLKGVQLCDIHRIVDERGWFSKSYTESEFDKLGIGFQTREVFCTESVQGTIRGLHFQSPPEAGAKLVTCLKGKIFDVLLDIRANSQSFGSFWSTILKGEAGQTLYLPEGIAHGYYVLEGPAIVVYQTEYLYSTEYDSGIRWDSIAIPWPIAEGSVPIVSPRDRALPNWHSFETPFT